jgi:5-methyltetrahydrofolate--homocysteine methyltransferase
MGTLLLSLGFQPPFEALNLNSPESVQSVHRDYVHAGAQILLTNTFSANSIRWKSISGRDDFEAVNLAAVDLARAAAREDVLVAGSIGPTGLDRTEIEALGFERLAQNFARQARVLIQAGVDALWIETVTNLPELRAVVEGCRSVILPGTVPSFSSEVGLLATVSVRLDGSLADGTALADWIAFLNGSSADIIGLNCSDAPEKLIPVIEALFSLATKPVALKLNAGLPSLRDGEAAYAMTAWEYARQLRPFLAKPCLAVIGGCCGVTPEFIRELAAMLKHP